MEYNHAWHIVSSIYNYNCKVNLMDMNALDVGTVLALVVFWFNSTKDKASQSEELGKMKQQIKSLETRAAGVDSQLIEINAKLNKLMESNARLETQLSLLLESKTARRRLNLLNTPMERVNEG